MSAAASAPSAPLVDAIFLVKERFDASFATDPSYAETVLTVLRKAQRDYDTYINSLFNKRTNIEDIVAEATANVDKINEMIAYVQSAQKKAENKEPVVPAEYLRVEYLADVGLSTLRKVHKALSEANRAYDTYITSLFSQENKDDSMISAAHARAHAVSEASHFAAKTIVAKTKDLFSDYMTAVHLPEDEMKHARHMHRIVLSSALEIPQEEAEKLFESYTALMEAKDKAAAEAVAAKVIKTIRGY